MCKEGGGGEEAARGAAFLPHRLAGKEEQERESKGPED